jgi:predicted nuclease of predicted toxin-antitoxin system
LDASEDVVIWKFAKKHDFVIVTKDSDFNDLSMIKGYPPKVIWLQIGNCKVDKIENIIRKNRNQINKFLNDSNLGVFHVEGNP